MLAGTQRKDISVEPVLIAGHQEKKKLHPQLKSAAFMPYDLEICSAFFLIHFS